MHDETLSTIEDHIAGCPDCQAALNRLVRNDAADVPSPLLPGRHDPLRLPGLVIERELGRGSMSLVYLARQPSLGRLVAMKVVRSGPAAGSREYARWLREGRSFSGRKSGTQLILRMLGNLLRPRPVQRGLTPSLPCWPFRSPRT